jgi:hypothetical protein
LQGDRSWGCRPNGATGRIAGTFESGSRDDNWNVSAVNPAIADNWANISALATWHAQADVNADVDLAAIVKAVETAAGVIVQVIAVVA